MGGAARRGLPSIVYVSSLSVFFVPGGPPVSPELPIAPATTAYARSKAQAEVYVRALQAKGAPIRMSYPAGIVGPDDPGMSDANHAVYTWFADLGVVTSSGFQCVDVRDVAALHVKLVELPRGRAPLRGRRRDAALGGDLPADGPHHGHARAALRGAGLADAHGRQRGRRGEARLRLQLPAHARQHGVRDAVAGRRHRAHHARARRRFRPIEETYRDTLRWMHRAPRT